MFDRSSRMLGQEVRKADSVSATLRRLGQYFRPYRLILLVTLLLIIAAVFMQVRIPDLTGQAVDCYLGPLSARSAASESFGAEMMTRFSDSSEQNAFSNCWYETLDASAETDTIFAGFSRLILLITSLYLGNALVGGLGFFLMSWAGYHVLRDLRADLFQHIHRLSLGYFSRNTAGDIMSRLTNDIDTLQQVIGFGLVSVFQSGLLIIWIVFTMFQKSVAFSLISLITLPLMFVVTTVLSNQARKAFRKARKEIGSVNADLQESISSVREVQAFNREDENIAQFRESNAANRDANIKAQAFTSALAPALEALSYVSLAVVAGVGGYFVLKGQDFMGTTVSLGLIITFIAYTQQFNRPVQQISVLWTNIQSAVAGAERIFNLLDEQPEIVDKVGAKAIPLIEGHVVFKGVSAEYNVGEPVLKSIDIEAKKGQTIAIVGPTGAGKTTIINLLPRFWDITEGSILIDGHDVRDVTRQSLREQIGIVLQDTFLFSDSVMNNIRYGRPDASDKDVIAAAKTAHAHDFINKLPEKYETKLGERGSGLSQGQRQLLAIARVVLMNPRMLILDEATSSVDTRTELKIQAALDELLQGRTSFVIAHRLSTIRNADQLLVLDDGEIIERGTHDTLMSAEGFYHDLYMSQFRRREDPALPTTDNE